jgi:hypothetical protein
MTSETFGIYVGTIYIQKGIELLVVDFTSDAAGWFSVVVAILFALFAYFMERTGTLSFGSESFQATGTRVRLMRDGSAVDEELVYGLFLCGCYDSLHWICPHVGTLLLCS